MKKLISFLSKLWIQVYSSFLQPYRNCSELPKWSFDKISETRDFSYLMPGSEYGKKRIAPKNAELIWDGILEEYSEKTRNNKTVFYFELLADIGDLENRAYFAEVMLSQIAKRAGSMTTATRKEYFKELREIRFYINEGKPLREEIDRLVKQLKAVRTKLEAKIKEAEDFAEKNFKGQEISTEKLKVKIQRALQVNLNLKEISVSEFLEWINEATESNGKK